MKLSINGISYELNSQKSIEALWDYFNSINLEVIPFEDSSSASKIPDYVWDLPDSTRREWFNNQAVLNCARKSDLLIQSKNDSCSTESQETLWQ